MLLRLLALLLVFQVACKPLLYPFARAFGSPAEQELAKRRVAFNHLKSTWREARVAICPVSDPEGRVVISPPSVDFQIQFLQNHGWRGVRADTQSFTPPSTPLMSNQLRYLETRIGLAGSWLKDHPPAGDYLLVVEVLSRPNAPVIGIQCYLLEASGQVAYSRLFNSHHFGKGGLPGPQAACRLALQTLVKDLERAAEDLFPPYGVG